jgi:hypothetical protein
VAMIASHGGGGGSGSDTGPASGMTACAIKRR